VAVNQLRIDGLAELREALKALPAELVGEASAIVHAHADAAAHEIGAGYPVKSGNLRAHLRVEFGNDAVSATARVRNTARHAYLFETGTKARRWKNGKNTGAMPAGRVFIPIAIQRRRIMLSALIDLVTRAGLHVSGAAG